jgi:hypothetical protein
MNYEEVIEKLIPCPFCGKKDKIEITYCDEFCCGARPRWINCDCGCQLYGNWYSNDDLINSWNDRQFLSYDITT